MNQIQPDRIAAAIAEFLDALGLSRTAELAEVPQRVARFYREWFEHLHSPPPELPLYPVAGAAQQTIGLRDVPFYSICSHHLLPFFGTVSIAYRPPRDEVLGFSGIVRIVRYFAARPTLQETLANAIVADIARRIGDGAAVYVAVEARQLCAEMRNVQAVGLATLTSAVTGGDAAWRGEAQRMLAKG